MTCSTLCQVGAINTQPCLQKSCSLRHAGQLPFRRPHSVSPSCNNANDRSQMNGKSPTMSPSKWRHRLAAASKAMPCVRELPDTWQKSFTVCSQAISGLQPNIHCLTFYIYHQTQLIPVFGSVLRASNKGFQSRFTALPRSSRSAPCSAASDSAAAALPQLKSIPSRPQET